MTMTLEPTLTDQERLEAAVSELDGLTADEIALYLREHLDQPAVCYNPYKCAVAAFIGKRLGFTENDYISVGVMGAYVQRGNDAGYGLLDHLDYQHVSLSHGTAQFINRFDRGLYPDLATPDSLPPV